MTQGWEKMSIAAFGEDDVWIGTLDRSQHLMQASCVVERERFARLERRQSDRFHRGQNDAAQATVLHWTVPTAVHAKHAKIVHESLVRPRAR
jgi:hypothetical protein